MALVSRGVQWGVTMVVAREQQVAGEFAARDFVQLAGFGGGMDDRETGLARDREVRVR